MPVGLPVPSDRLGSLALDLLPYPRASAPRLPSLTFHAEQSPYFWFADDTKSGAAFSPCRTYRYKLWRTWDAAKPHQLWIMLNPSTADETENDPTVERCQRRAQASGYGGLVVCNLFALRSADPDALYQHEHPIGPANIDVILAEAKRADQIILGWGNHGVHLNRGVYTIAALEIGGHKLFTLGTTKSGQPKHPLYISYEVQPQPL